MTENYLTAENFRAGLAHLSASDADLCAVIEEHGPPPMWNRQPGFATLVHIVLEQQVSLASAKAAYDRLNEILPVFTPERFLQLDDHVLGKIGFSRQKKKYARNIALAILNRELNLDELAQQTDDEVRRELQKISGIGIWTADIYLLMALNRTDIWPTGDLALINSLQSVKKLPARPTVDEFKQHGEAWKPWRAVAARILWHHYLS